MDGDLFKQINELEFRTKYFESNNKTDVVSGSHYDDLWEPFFKSAMASLAFNNSNDLNDITNLQKKVFQMILSSKKLELNNVFIYFLSPCYTFSILFQIF